MFVNYVKEGWLITILGNRYQSAFFAYLYIFILNLHAPKKSWIEYINISTLSVK